MVSLQHRRLYLLYSFLRIFRYTSSFA
jgi:hypothetical protein